MNLAQLADEMRLAGIRSLSIELEPATDEPAERERPSHSAETLPPSEPPEEKGPNACAVPGCTNDKGGIFGGIGGDLCRMHALLRAGVHVK